MPLLKKKRGSLGIPSIVPFTLKSSDLHVTELATHKEKMEVIKKSTFNRTPAWELSFVWKLTFVI